MKDNGGGNIIFVNSNTAYRAIPDRVAYVTSKGAQLGMMRALAMDLGKYNIRVNAVLPGMIRTDRWVKNPDFYAKVPSRYTPIGDVADGADVADAIYYFAAHARNTTGAELVVDGGNTIQLYPIIPEV
jgi:NAD(P)-dependent dehydrogenase (short-subunit alcohol dehydrogenase family)